jgi:CPA2 family monovalent cation:H+ antiporter-2
LATAGAITFVDVGWALLKVCVFMAAALGVGYLLIPRLIAFVAGFKRGEMLTVTVLGLAFGLAVLGGHLGFSIALGAFLMGAIVAEAAEAHQVVERVEPIREMFSAVFFVATGMLLDPLILADLWGAVVLITLITVFGKILSCSFGTFLAGYSGQVALPVGLGMAQIGEFSFIIANLGRTAGVTSGALYPIAVAVSSLTTFLTPYLLRSAHRITAMLSRFSPRPLVTFATFYIAWLSRLSDRASGAEIQKLFSRLMLYLAATVGLFVVIWSGARLLLPELPAIVPRQSELLQWGLAAIAVLPFLFIIGRTLESLTQSIATTLFQRPKGGTAGAAGLVRNSLRFLFGWVAAVFVLAVGSPVLPSLAPLIVVVFGLLVTTFLFWESLVRFHARIEGLLGSLGDPGPVADSPTALSQWQGRQEVTRLLSDRYGPEVQTEDFIVPLHPTDLNQTLQALEVRTLTGASIIAIYRSPDQVIVPQADAVILPGDVLLLLGEREQVEAATRYLAELSKRKAIADASPPRAATVVIAAESPISGCTLAETGFRERLRVLVVGIRRGEERVTNPGPDFRIQVGDVLYLWGSPEQIEEARRLTGSR